MRDIREGRKVFNVTGVNDGVIGLTLVAVKQKGEKMEIRKKKESVYGRIVPRIVFDRDNGTYDIAGIGLGEGLYCCSEYELINLMEEIKEIIEERKELINVTTRKK